MDREVIDQKLESLRRCLQRIQSKCPEHAEQLAADLDLQDIVALTAVRLNHMRRAEYKALARLAGRFCLVPT